MILPEEERHFLLGDFRISIQGNRTAVVLILSRFIHGGEYREEGVWLEDEVGV